MVFKVGKLSRNIMEAYNDNFTKFIFFWPVIIFFVIMVVSVFNDL